MRLNSGVRHQPLRCNTGPHMTEHPLTTTTGTGLSGGDWVMAVISFFLTPLIPILLAIYNFARSRQPQGRLYLGVLGLQVAVIVLLLALG